MQEPVFYIKKPVKVLAIQWTGTNLLEVVTFLGGELPKLGTAEDFDRWGTYKDAVTRDGLEINTPACRMPVEIGGFITKDAEGDNYVYSNEAFTKTHEEVK